MIKKALIIFYIFYYLIPSIHSLVNPSFYKEVFHGEMYYLSLIYTTIFFILTYYFSKVNFGFLEIKQFRYLRYFFNKKVEWLFILIFLVTSYIFYFKYGLQFRHTGVGLSTAGSILYINYITKIYIKLFLFKQIIICYRKSYKPPTLKLFFVLIGGFLSMSGAMDAFVIIFVLIIVFRPDIIYQNLSNHKSFFIIICLIIAISVPLIGTANKLGYEQAFIVIQENYYYFFEVIIRRIAVWNQSVNVYLTLLSSEIIYDPSEIILNIINTTINRIEIVFGGIREIPEIQSINRLNYINLFKSTLNDKSGTSPGIVATSLIFYFPLGLILLSIFLGQFYKYIFSMISAKINIITHVFILLIIILPVVSSPIDLINIIGPTSFFIFFLISMKQNIKLTKV